MALILNIETSTTVCSVALGKDGKLIDLEESKEQMEHAEKLTVFIEILLKRNSVKVDDLDAIAVSKGPGSYTGLRIGVSTAKGLCYGSRKPLIAVSTLQALASNLLHYSDAESKPTNEKAWLCPMIDARRMEVYTSFFDNELTTMKEISAEIITEDSFKDMLDRQQLVFFGNGAMKCADTLKNANAIIVKGIEASSRGMVNLAEKAFNDNRFEDVAYFEPFYLKDFVAIPPKNKVL